jgi:pimeloyl-ACP methyl ester carboxylesterase
VTDVPNTRYATTHDGVSIAYQIVGDGPIDLVLELESWGNVEIMWELDALADLFERLSQFSRLVLHDRRGTGLSGGVSFPNLETRARDLLAVLDAIRSPRAVLFGERTEGAAFSVFAASSIPPESSRSCGTGQSRRSGGRPSIRGARRRTSIARRLLRLDGGWGARSSARVARGLRAKPRWGRALGGSDRPSRSTLHGPVDGCGMDPDRERD